MAFAKDIVALSFAVALALPAAGKVDAVHKDGLPDKREGVVREQFLGRFDACSFNLEYSLKDGEIVNKRWGDYFFGLRLGYSPKNGGWSIWDFLRVWVRTPKGVVNALSTSRPIVFAGYSAGGADLLAAEWETEGGKRLRLRFASFPSHPDWLFARVELGEADVVRVSLSAYPGNAAVPEGRERHLATKERDWHLNVEAAQWRPATPFALLYSRHVDELFGNKLVLDPAALETVRAGRTSSGVTLDCFPAKGAKAATFALGYFAHKTPDDQLARFLGEDGDAIFDFLKSVDWDAEPSTKDIRASMRIALEIGVDVNVLKGIARRCKAAVKARDIAGLSACEAELERVRRERVREGLAEFGAKVP